MADLFYCFTCLEDKNRNELSPDPRYCQSCYDFLFKEAESLPAGQRPSWIPRPGAVKPISNAVVSPQAVDKNHIPALIGSAIMSTLDSTNETVIRRGAKSKDLPVELISRWASEGNGSKAITSKLNEQGIQVSYKTIQRVLSGERKISN